MVDLSSSLCKRLPEGNAAAHLTVFRTLAGPEEQRCQKIMPERSCQIECQNNIYRLGCISINTDINISINIYIYASVSTCIDISHMYLYCNNSNSDNNYNN